MVFLQRWERIAQARDENDSHGGVSSFFFSNSTSIRYDKRMVKEL